jgi:predicted SAM-dependent methyltransferase
MLEHLDRIEARRFLDEAHRILISGGIIRLAVPDIMKLIKKYLDDGDADAFVKATYMCVPRPRTMPQRMALLLAGTRHHQWMYDSGSLRKLLAESRFKDAKPIAPGSTQIADCEPLDLFERQDESIYVEAIKP